MRMAWRWAAVVLAGAAALACAHQAPIPPAQPAASLPTAKPVIPSSPPVVISTQSDVVLTVSETVNSAEDDIASYTKVYVDNLPSGQTDIGPKSQPKHWGAVLPPGNHLFRFETWDLPPSGEWEMLDPQWEPPERFIRVLDGQKTDISLRYYDHGFKNELTISQEAQPK